MAHNFIHSIYEKAKDFITPDKSSAVSSSNLRSVRWNRKQMHITFNDGSEYIYEAVPENLYDGLVNASSAGKYFIRRIKFKFATTKIG